MKVELFFDTRKNKIQEHKVLIILNCCNVLQPPITLKVFIKIELSLDYLRTLL